MPHTLRRKMFKLGGEVNSHGVGLTSGLNYNRPGYNDGGKVDPRPVGYMRGPDGKMREAHNPLLAGLVGAGGAGGAILGTLARLLGRRAPGFITRRADPRGIMGFLRGDPITKRMMGKSLPGVAPKAYDIITKVPSATAGARALRAAQLATAPVGLGLAGAGIGSALLPDIPEKVQENVPLLNLIQGGRDWLLEPLADFTPLGLASWLATGETPTSGIDKLMGRDPASVKVTADDTKGPVAEGIETQQEEFAALKADAEKRAQLYMDLLGEEPDKMGAISRGLIQAGQLWDEDRGAAIGALGTEAGAETQRIKDLEDQFRGMAVQEVVGGDLAQQQALDQAKVQLLSDPQLDPSMRSQGLKGIEAYEAGVTDILPLNAKQDAADGSRLSAGSVYYDPTNLYGGMYVGVSSNPDDPDGQVQGFDSAEEARAHAAG